MSSKRRKRRVEHRDLVRLELLVAVALEDRQEGILDPGRDARELLEDGERAVRGIGFLFDDIL
jgi:hypothetical protein